MKKILFTVFLLLCINIKNAEAQLFNVSVTRVSSGQNFNSSFNSAQDAINYFNSENLNTIFGTNVDGEAININLNYLGLNSSLAYDGGSNLTLNIDNIVSNKVFSGGNRDQSIELLKDYLKSDGGDILNQINRRLAAISPSSPIAGNPTSLMSQMVDDDFELAFTDSLHDTSATDDNGKKIGNEMGAGVKYSNYNVAGIRSYVASVSPFSYRRNIADSDVKLLLKIPVLKMISTENAKTYQASSAIGLHVPLYKDFWSAAAIASIGAVGSEDMYSAAAMNGLSITNKLKYNTENGFGFHLGTLYGSYKTDRLSFNNYSSNPGIRNNILKNSFVVSVPTRIFQNYNTDFSVTNTRFYGTQLYIDNTMDYGIGFVKTSNRDNNEMRVDLKYYSYNSNSIATIGNGTRKVSGFSVNLKVQY